MVLSIILINKNKSKRQQIVDKIPIRISLNGIKGKSIITNLVSNILIEAGYKVIGKTANESSDIILGLQNGSDDEYSKLQHKTNNDKFSVLKNASELGVDAVIYENIDADSASKKVSKFNELNENIAVISEISEDYVEEDDKLVQSFAKVIPYEGYLVTTNNNYTDYFKSIARERNTKVIIADNSKITYKYLDLFDYDDVSVENAALSIAVGEALGIDEKTCLRGMVNINTKR